MNVCVCMSRVSINIVHIFILCQYICSYSFIITLLDSALISFWIGPSKQCHEWVIVGPNNYVTAKWNGSVQHFIENPVQMKTKSTYLFILSLHKNTSNFDVVIEVDFAYFSIKIFL